MKTLVLKALGHAWGLAALALLLAWASSRTASAQAAASPDRSSRTDSRTARVEGLAAWDQIYSVLTHPRCINCHTATNYPQQGNNALFRLTGKRYRTPPLAAL